MGETETLILHLEAIESPEGLAAGLRMIPGVIRADSGEDGEVTIITPEAEEILAPAVTLANEQGIRIRSIDIREPDLEAVFLPLTGRALRD